MGGWAGVSRYLEVGPPSLGLVDRQAVLAERLEGARGAALAELPALADTLAPVDYLARRLVQRIFGEAQLVDASGPLQQSVRAGRQGAGRRSRARGRTELLAGLDKRHERAPVARPSVVRELDRRRLVQQVARVGMRGDPVGFQQRPHLRVPRLHVRHVHAVEVHVRGANGGAHVQQATASPRGRAPSPSPSLEFDGARRAHHQPATKSVEARIEGDERLFDPNLGMAMGERKFQIII